MKWLLAALGAVFLGCGGDDEAASDAGAAMDVGSALDAPSPADAGPPPEGDAGPAPACDLATASFTFAEGFGGARDATLDGFAAVAPDGPFAFGWRSASSAADRSMRLEVALVGADGAVIGPTVLSEAMGTRVRIGQVALGPAAEGVFAAWEHVTTNMDGMVVASEIRHAALAADGSIARAEALLYANAAAPFLAADPPSDLWVLRSDLELMGTTTGVIPRLQHLDGNGAPLAEAVPAQSFVRVEATEVMLEARGVGPVLAYRVPPSTAMVVPLDRTPVPMRPERMVYDVPFLDDVAATDESIALAWSETAGGTARVGVVVTDGEGHEIGRATLDEFDATYAAHVAVVAAWPAFVAVWRVGEGPDTVLRAAGIGARGGIVVPPIDLASVPDLTGDVLAVTNGSALTVGYRVSPRDTMPMLGMTRACVPR